MCRKFKAVITLLMHTTSYLSSRKIFEKWYNYYQQDTYNIYDISYEVRISIFYYLVRSKKNYTNVMHKFSYLLRIWQGIF